MSGDDPLGLSWWFPLPGPHVGLPQRTGFPYFDCGPSRDKELAWYIPPLFEGRSPSQVPRPSVPTSQPSPPPRQEAVVHVTFTRKLLKVRSDGPLSPRPGRPFPWFVLYSRS